MKLNLDASLSVSTNGAGLGSVVRNSQGTMPFAYAIFQRVFDNIEITKALVVVRGLFSTKQRGWSNIEIEPDALNMTNALNSSAHFRSELRMVLEDTRDLILHISVIFMHAPRNVYYVAHNIASYA